MSSIIQYVLVSCGFQLVCPARLPGETSACNLQILLRCGRHPQCSIVLGASRRGVHGGLLGPDLGPLTDQMILPLYRKPWALNVHPGATQTSGLKAAYNRSLRQIELWEDEFQLALAK